MTWNPTEANNLSAADVKASVSIASVVSNYVDLKRKGGSLMGLCPFHNENTPSLSVTDGKGVFHCFGCHAAGDVIAFVQKIEGVDFKDALLHLANGNYDVPRRQASLHKNNEQDINRARFDWENCFDIAGTPAERYLVKRHIPPEIIRNQIDLRCGRFSFDGSTELHFALVAAVRDVSGSIIALQRTFLTKDGEKLTARSKRNLASGKGGAVHLNNPLVSGKRAGEDIIVCEGLEDGLTLARLCPDQMILVAGGTSNLQAIELPPFCSSVTIAPDNDAPGWKAANQLSKRLVIAGIDVSIFAPDDHFKDWNDWLCTAEAVPEGEFSGLPWRDEEDFEYFLHQCERDRIEHERRAFDSIVLGEGSYPEDAE
jgi:DNA primase